MITDHPEDDAPALQGNGQPPEEDVVANLIRTWRNERMAPQLLPFSKDLIEKATEFCDRMVRNSPSVMTVYVEE